MRACLGAELAKIKKFAPQPATMVSFRSQLAALGACSLLLLLVNAWQRGTTQPVAQRRRRDLQRQQQGQPSVATQSGDKHKVPPASPTSPSAAAVATAVKTPGTSSLDEACEGVEHLELVRLLRSNGHKRLRM